MQYDTTKTRENLNEKKVNVENKNRWSSDWKAIWNVKIRNVKYYKWMIKNMALGWAGLKFSLHAPAYMHPMKTTA